MANPLKCDACEKAATVHLTQIINNQIHKIDLCESCAEQKGITDPSGYSLADLLVKPDAQAANETRGAAAVCPSCGCTQRDFKRTGRLGCSDCYEAFDSQVTPALINMHRGDSHKGKAPQRAAVQYDYRDRLGSLEAGLQDAIKSERYEDAARMRDEIIELKKAMQEIAAEQ